MCLSYAHRFATCVALVMSFAQAASAAEILIADAKSQPERNFSMDYTLTGIGAPCSVTKR
jgi:hypothetical protein